MGVIPGVCAGMSVDLLRVCLRRRGEGVCERDRQRDRHRDRKTERYRDTETQRVHRETERHREKERQRELAYFSTHRISGLE